jgi:AcrR family transcriptional regulator
MISVCGAYATGTDNHFGVTLFINAPTGYSRTRVGPMPHPWRKAWQKLMARKEHGQETHHRIVETAKRLFYTQGYGKTSFTDIADSAKVPRGNFYYYFKSKDEILDAVVKSRMENVHNMLKHWEEQYPEPKQRLKRFVDILLNEEQDIMHYGCPLGSLAIELTKTQHTLKPKVTEIFDLFFTTIKEQFQALGKGKAAKNLALHLLATTQGIVVISTVVQDPKFIRREASDLKQWIESQ